MPLDITPADLQHPHPHAPDPGHALLVAPGIFWIRMPLPFALDHINLWVLEDGDGWTIIDTGLARDDTKDLWLTQLGSTFTERPVSRIIVTHFHPDHIGNAGWLVEQCQAPLWIARTEWLMHQMLVMDNQAVMHHAQIDAYEAAGLGPEWTQPLRELGNTYHDRVDHAPTTYTRLKEGDEIAIDERRWRVIVGTGHVQEHVCLYCPSLNVLISGDQVLPKITPNISLWANDEAGDPLGDYLSSLRKFDPLPADTLVLPSHGLPFTGLPIRIDQLARHHEERLSDLMAACDHPMTATDILPVLFKRKLDLHQIGFAMGEALAHLNHLTLQGKLSTDQRQDGVTTYQRA